MRNIAIITARSGSKGLPDKNIKLLRGKPLMWYSINAAIKSGCFEEVMVSTDSDEYKEIAVECGAHVPFLRSARNSGSTASSWDTVKEVLEGYRGLGEEFDTVALLQPTSPLRTPKHIREGYELLSAKEANAIIGVAETEHSPLWENILPSDFNMAGFIKPEILNQPRQKLPVYYRINGALYIVRVGVLHEIERLYDNKCFAYVMSKMDSVDIDTDLDFRLAEVLMEIKRDL